MPNSVNKLSNLKNLNSNKTDTILDQNNLIKKLSSYNKTKTFKKRNLKTDVLPAMTVKPELIEAFRKEAQSKDWKLTTLMNKILEERYKMEKTQNEDD